MIATGGSMRSDLTRLILSILFIAGMIGVSIWILRPFLPAIVWATTLVIATWPILRRVEARLWDSRGLATLTMTIALLLVFVLPFWLAIGTIGSNAGQILAWAETIATTSLPPPPHWVAEIPLIGTGVAQAWDNASLTGSRELLQKARPYAGMLTNWFIGAVGSFGAVLLQFLLTVAISAIMYQRGELAAETVVRFAHRLAGERGRQSAVLAAQAIRGVALGVVVTAFIQSAIGAFALLVASVPYAPVLCAIMFMLCIAQLGPALVLVPVVIWLFVNGQVAMGTFVLVCSIAAIVSDNFLRPILIRKGVDLPILLILVGVVGGLVAFGLIGLFLGPTVLAVSYTLLAAWIAEDRPTEAPQSDA
jgi:predicted PurR-regulated permease PerM